MGMAASQARYLALVARKSNCEYEGQQINQARTALSNQSANLFNQMLGLKVPIPPSTQDFTKTQYSYTDGINASTISSWQQLSETDPDYNYVVTHYYYTDRYTGSMKKLTDPQVQFSQGGSTTNGAQIKQALDLMATEWQEYEAAKAARIAKELEAATLSNYADTSTYTGINENKYNVDSDIYTVGFLDPAKADVTFTGYDKLDEDDKELVSAAIQTLIDEGALKGPLDKFDMSEIYYNSDAGDIVFEDDLKDLYGGAGSGTKTVLPKYNITTIGTTANGYDDEIDELRAEEDQALDDYNQAETAYNALNRPTYIGNCELTPLATLTEDQLAEINQVIADMKEQEIETTLEDCFDGAGNYTGGIYQFKLNGVTYYTTFDDLESSYASGTGNNNIDGQLKMAYYNATYISTKVEETEKALLETDGTGRFTSVRFENDTVTYTLNMESVTDEAAYNDAMNQYYYENAKYDKMIQDINAQTSIIHQQDQQLELRLKQLDTEQSALSTEMEAVKKVVDDNVESSFKTFNG